MMFTMLGTAAPAFAAAPGAGTSVTIKAEPKETQEPYYPGDTINFTVTLGPTSELIGLRFQLAIPEGLTYVPNSGKAAPNLPTTMNAVKAEFVEVSHVFAFYGNTHYESSGNTELMTFQCTVDPDCVGQRTVGYVEKYNQAFNLDNEDIPCPFNTCDVNVMVKHNVNALKNEHGTISASTTSTYAGDQVTLSAVANEGYHFGSWLAVSPEGLVIRDNKFTMPDEDVTVSAVFLPDLYTVTVDGVPHKNVPHDSKLGDILPEKNPTQEGHTFVGWTANGETVTADTIVKGPMDVKSVFSTDEYQVTIFDGSNTTRHTVRYDSKLGEILPQEDPTKEGWTFDYWSAGGKRVDADTVVKGPMSVEAIFSKNRYLIVVDGVEHPGVEYGTLLSEVLPQEDPAKTGYAFVGWFVDDQEITRDAAITGNMVIESKFTPNPDTKYTVKHLFETLDGLGYTADEEKTQVMTGTTDTRTAAQALTVEGFTAQPIEQVNIAPDGSAVVEIRYTRNSYTVTVGGQSQDVKYGTAMKTVLPEDPARPGYTFVGWFDGDTQITGKTLVKGEINAQAKFTANEDTAYVVNHMLEDLDGEGYTMTERFTAYGTTDTETAAAAREYEGFTAQPVVQKNINGDGSTVVEVRYTRNTYTVKVDQWTYQVKYGDTLARCLAKVPSKEGYTFLGWFADKSEVTADTLVKGDMTIHSDFYPNPDTPYTVKYLFEDLKGGTYTVDESQTQHLTGTTDTMTQVRAKEFEGFTAQMVDQKNIAPNGSTVIEIRYTRNAYTVTVDGKATRNVKYGDNLEGLLTEDPARAGYTFDRWLCEDKIVTTDTLVRGNMTIESQWIANTDTKYIVKHLLENLENSGFTAAEGETQHLTGTTDTQTAAAAREYEGFTAQPVVQKNINGDGSTVVEVRYTRNTYTVTVGDKSIENVKYGTSMKGRMPADPVREGYTFEGWFDGDTEITAETVVRGEINASARMIPNSQTKYVVKHMMENLEDEGFTVDATERKHGTTDSLTEAAARTYEGFTAQPVVQQNIKGDGSTVIEIHYLRDTYTVTVDGKANEHVKHGAKLGTVLPEDPVRPGQNFSGWYMGDMGVTADTVVKSDMVIISRWDLDTYTVTFQIPGKEDVVVRDVKHGTLLSELMPEDPALEGYTFEGWLLGGAKPAEDLRVTGNLTVTAKMTPKVYQITFKAEGMQDRVINVSYGETIGDKLPQVQAKAGYTFEGWFDGKTEVDADTVVRGDLTAEAVFTANPNTSYTVKHLLQNLENNRYTEAEEDTQLLTGTTDTQTEAVAKSYEGFTAEPVVQKNINGDGSTVVEIRYTRNTYTVTIGDKVMENVKFGESLKGRMPKDAVREGHTFRGWFDGDTQITEDTVVRSEINAQAKFQVNTYTITIDGEKHEKVPYGTKLSEILPRDPSKEGETFVGWFDGGKQVTGDTLVKGEMTITSKFAVNTYTITIDGEKHENVPYGTQLSEVLPADPAKEGHTFRGWFLGEEQVTGSTVVRGEMTIVSKFTVNTYAVIVDGEQRGNFAYGTKLSEALPEAPVREGETFVGWFVEDKQVTGDTLIKGEMNIASKFTVNTYTVTIDGEKHEDVAYGTKLSAILPKDPVKEGHTFQGWFVGQEQVNGETVVKGAMTITSKFTVNTYTVTIDGEKHEDVAYGTKLSTILPEAPSKEGQTFQGWFDGGKQVSGETVVKGEMTITSKFTVNTYTVTIDGEKHKDVAYGTKLSTVLPEDPAKDGQTFLGWFVGEEQVTGDTLVKGDMNITSKFQMNSFDVTFRAEGQKDVVITVNYGETIGSKLPEVPAKDGFTFLGWFADEAEITEKTVVKSELTAAAKWQFNGFPDVKPGDWFYNGVMYSAEKGFMSGLPDGTFGPAVTMTRAQLVQMLYAFQGKPDVAVTDKFSDVKAGDWFAKAVSWAVEKGVTSGVGDGTTFAPNAKITRQEMAVMLYAFQGRPAVKGELNFRDNAQNADWAAEAVQWAVSNKLMGSTATDAMVFSPKNTATRAEAAIILMNLDKLS